MPSLDLMERAGTRPRPSRGRGHAAPADRGSWSARATTAATAWWRRGCCARTGARWTCSPPPTWRSCAATRGDARPAARRAAAAVRPRAARRAPARSSTRCSAPASRARRASRSRGAIAAINAQDAPGGRVRRAVGRERLERRGGGPGRARARHRHLPRHEDRAARGARQAARRARCEVVDIGIPHGAPAPRSAGLIARARARPGPAPAVRRRRSSSRAWW